jgi:hypothetical protein
MENESHTNKSFNIENCRAENIIKDWVDCLSPEQATTCGFSASCGNGYHCEHPHRFKIVANTEILKGNLFLPPSILQSDEQEGSHSFSEQD